jgi:hypothetical protein
MKASRNAGSKDDASTQNRHPFATNFRSVKAARSSREDEIPMLRIADDRRFLNGSNRSEDGDTSK